MKQIRSVLVAATLASTMPAVQAQGEPSLESCTQYAEADVVFEAAIAQPLAAYEAAEHEAGAAYEAASQEAFAAWNAHEWALIKAGADPDAAELEALRAYGAAMEEASAAFKAAKQEARAIYAPPVHEAQTAHTETYLAIYTESGGMRSDVWEVQRKLILRHRELCTQLYGL